MSRVGKSWKKTGRAEPLRIVDGAVEVVGGLVAFELALASGLLCFGKKGGRLVSGQRLEIPRDIQSLVHVGKGLATGDDDAGGQAHGVAETLDGRDGVAFEQDSGTHGLHAEDADFIFHEDGKDSLPETLVVRVHGVEGHLDGVEMKLMRGGGFISTRSEEHTSELQSHLNLVCRLLLEKKKNHTNRIFFEIYACLFLIEESKNTSVSNSPQLRLLFSLNFQRNIETRVLDISFHQNVTFR